MEKMQHELILVIDFGGQYNQLIARRVRECGVYCEIIPYTYTLEQIKAKNPKGIIFTGGPNSVYAEETPKVDAGVFELGIPVLGTIPFDKCLVEADLAGKPPIDVNCPAVDSIKAIKAKLEELFGEKKQ